MAQLSAELNPSDCPATPKALNVATLVVACETAPAKVPTLPAGELITGVAKARPSVMVMGASGGFLHG